MVRAAGSADGGRQHGGGQQRRQQGWWRRCVPAGRVRPSHAACLTAVARAHWQATAAAPPPPSLRASLSWAAPPTPATERWVAAAPSSWATAATSQPAADSWATRRALAVRGGCSAPQVGALSPLTRPPASRSRAADAHRQQHDPGWRGDPRQQREHLWRRHLRAPLALLPPQTRTDGPPPRAGALSRQRRPRRHRRCVRDAGRVLGGGQRCVERRRRCCAGERPRHALPGHPGRQRGWRQRRRHVAQGRRAGGSSGCERLGQRRCRQRRRCRFRGHRRHRAAGAVRQRAGRQPRGRRRRRRLAGMAHVHPRHRAAHQQQRHHRRRALRRRRLQPQHAGVRHGRLHGPAVHGAAAGFEHEWQRSRHGRKHLLVPRRQPLRRPCLPSLLASMANARQRGRHGGAERSLRSCTGGCDGDGCGYGALVRLPPRLLQQRGQHRHGIQLHCHLRRCVSRDGAWLLAN